jgi:dipeptidyl-peptidase-4
VSHADARHTFQDWLASEHGYIVVDIDTEGTAGYDLATMFSVRHTLGERETSSQLAALDTLLGTHLAAVADASRVGVFGWSYGGFMSLSLASHHGVRAAATSDAYPAASDIKFPDGADSTAAEVDPMLIPPFHPPPGSTTSFTLRGAVSVAPVTDWLLYDTIYTERYMGTPTENKAGFLSTSLLRIPEEQPSQRGASSPLTPAQRLALSRLPVLVAAGTGDDNVHFQNTAQWADVATAAGAVAVETAVFPDRNHSIYGGGARESLWSKIAAFLIRHVGSGPLEPE